MILRPVITQPSSDRLLWSYGGFGGGAFGQSLDSTDVFFESPDTIVVNQDVSGLGALKVHAGSGSEADANREVKGFMRFYSPIVPGDVDFIAATWFFDRFANGVNNGSLTLTLMSNDYNPYETHYSNAPPVSATDPHFTVVFDEPASGTEYEMRRECTFDMSKVDKVIYGVALTAKLNTGTFIGGSVGIRVQTRKLPLIFPVIAREAKIMTLPFSNTTTSFRLLYLTKGSAAFWGTKYINGPFHVNTGFGNALQPTLPIVIQNVGVQGKLVVNGGTGGVNYYDTGLSNAAFFSSVGAYTNGTPDLVNDIIYVQRFDNVNTYTEPKTPCAGFCYFNM